MFKNIGKSKGESQGLLDAAFEAGLRKDVNALNDYAEAWWNLGEVLDEAEIKRRTITKGSAEVQKWAQEHIDLVKDNDRDIGKMFATEARKRQLSQSLDGSLSSAISAIKLYNSGLKTAGLTQKEFHEAIAEANPALDSYITKMEADGKKPTEWGYIWATKQAAIETALFTSAIAAGQLALNAVAKNADPQAAKIVGALTSVAGGITAVVSAIGMAKGALSLTAGVGWISAGLAALTAGIGAVNTASQRMREAWQEDIDKIEDVKQSSEELTEAYTNVSKYLTALKNGEDVGDDLNDAVTALNKALGDNKVQFDEASMSAEEYAKRVAQASKEALQGTLAKAKVSEDSAAQMLKSKMPLGGLVGSSVSVKYKDDAVVNEILSKYLSGYFYELGGANLFGNREGTLVVKKGKTTDETANNILDYYNGLVEAREALSAKGKSDNKAWKVLSSEITKYESAVEDLIDARYQVAKLEYETQNGIPTTKEEYDQLTESLEGVADATGSQYLKQALLSKAYDEFGGRISNLNATITKGDGAARVIAKSAGEYLDEVQEGYDGLSEAMKQFAEDGYLSADSLSTLYNLQKENKLGGLDLANVIERTAHGYVIAADSLEQYVDQLIAANSNYTEFATVQDRQTAIDNLMNLRAVLLTLQRTQAAAAASNRSKAAKEALEAQKDALNDQIDKYKKLIELRKKLLQTYENEQKYQRELNKKQQNLANLQTQLSVSTLDTSAAGIARTRELSNQVTEAQDALDDYTLEHAVQQIETDLDEQYGEYENFIEGKMAAIEKAIKDLDNTAKASVDMSWIDGALSDADRLLEELRRQLDSSGAMIEDKFNEVIEKMHGTPSEVKVKGKGSLPSFTVSQMYHSGGVVGGEALKHNEEFAKLLKGEFVSTPAQMQKFMNDTLPRMVTYAGRSNEFNAPLIAINCDNVTSEAMPKLKEVVNEAVEKIKQELNSGMSRAGYKGTVQKLLV